MDILSLKEWNLVSNGRPLTIAGPCSAETEKQVMDTAKQLSANGITVFRAGVWKPRTRPGTFEGVGRRGLPWMKAVKEETGMLTTIEVATAKHVEEALKHGIDILWAGARTSANPFAIQDIADALKGVDIPVLVKNPVNPDVELWYGAIERLHLAGIKRIGAIHRGFSGLSVSKFRNEPLWQVPINLRLKNEKIPMFCDPSHIAGRRDLIHFISQKAMDLNYDGLMIESHIDPENAWSDAKQQVTPAALDEILKKLIIRDKQAGNRDFKDCLEELRINIDEFDDQLISIVEERMKVVREIGEIKSKNNVTVLQSGRWNDILEDAFQKAEKSGLSKKFIKKLFQAIHQESIDIQTRVLNA